ncbi:MAG: alpha/beta hydrolase [Eubacteriales bacterium]|nr:alpha/beta hydrolase [Eubacteriales bacterium]
MICKEFYIMDDQIRLHAKLEKKNEMEKCPLAIVIHGFTGHMEEDHIIAACHAMHKAGLATLRVEMYGHGGSGGNFMDHTLFKWISNAHAATDYAKSLDFVTDLYLCGHSQGGLLTILVAGMRPDDFKAIIPLSPATIILDGAKSGNLLGTPFDPNHIPDVLKSKDLELSGHYIRAAQYLHIEDGIKRYHGPVLIVHGAADQTVPVQYAYDAAALYDNCELAIIEGDSHCFDYHVDQMAEAIYAFVSK